MIQTIRKAVIPAAGFGTRFLPATKAQPKEMLPVVDKPVIQYVVEEAVASGITDIIIVTGPGKRAVEDHFDYPYELEKHLLKSKKRALLEEMRTIATMANFIYIRQKGPYGNATPVLCAKEVIGDEPFAVLWGDEFIYAKPPRLKQMIDVYNKFEGAVISGIKIPKKKDLSRYGLAKLKSINDDVARIIKIVEKPQPDKAPSNIATHGAYIFPSKIFSLIEKLKSGKGGEIWLVDAINKLAQEQAVYAAIIKDATYYDTGNKFGLLKANIEFGLKHPETKKDLKKYLKKL